MKQNRPTPSPKTVALAAVTILRERLDALEELINEKQDDADKVPVGLSNEYQQSVERTARGLAVACWSTHQEYTGNEPPPETSPDAYHLARVLLNAIAEDATEEVAVHLAANDY